MSCSDSPKSCGDSDSDVIVEREIELPAPPGAVWDDLAGILGDEVELDAEPGGALRVRGPEGERVGVVLEADPGARLTFRWVQVDTDDPPSEVEIALEWSGVATFVHIRETRLDGAQLERSTLLGRASARA